MGPGLSSNFDSINYIFTTGCWKVHSAVSKRSGERVCLWMIDQALLDHAVMKNDQDAYLKGVLSGLQKARKIVHPKILRVLEVQETLPSLAFASEPVSSCLTTLIGSLDPIDSAYIGFQILDALSFVHLESHQVHLGLCPSAVFVNETLGVKLFNFNWATMCDGQLVDVPFGALRIEPGMPDVNYTAPEVVVSRKCCFETDTFAFACLFYEMLSAKQLRKIWTMGDYDSNVSPALYTPNVPQEYYQMLGQCFQPSPQNRLTAQGLMATDMFQTVQVKVLRYLDMIITKDPKDKFGFFKGLANAISDFSPLMIKTKILPIIVRECKTDKRFAPVLLGTIFHVAEKFSVSEFTNDVFKEIAFLTTINDPPQIAIALLQSIGLILDKTEPAMHSDSVYPIVFNALQSQIPMVQKECVSKLGVVIEKMPSNVIRTGLLPRITDLAIKATDINIVASAIKAVATCLSKTDHDTFIIDNLPSVFEAWKEHQQTPVAEAILEIIEALNASNKNNMFGKVVQVAAHVTASPACPDYVQKRLCNWMINTVTGFKLIHQLDRQIEKPTYIPPPKQRPAAPVITPSSPSTPASPSTMPSPVPGGSAYSSPYQPPQNVSNPFASSSETVTPQRQRRQASGPLVNPQNPTRLAPPPGSMQPMNMPQAYNPNPIYPQQGMFPQQQGMFPQQQGMFPQQGMFQQPNAFQGGFPQNSFQPGYPQGQFQPGYPQNAFPAGYPQGQFQPGFQPGMGDPGARPHGHGQGGQRDILDLFQDSAREIVANVASGNASNLYELFRP